MKQTAVEWLVEQLNQKIDFIPLDKWDMIRNIVLQAKEMEKEQIKDAYRFGLSDEYVIGSQKYYNETYGGNK